MRRYRITSPDGKHTTTLMAVLPKGADVNAYLADAAKRFDWAAYEEAQKVRFKIRIGQQKHRKR